MNPGPFVKHERKEEGKAERNKREIEGQKKKKRERNVCDKVVSRHRRNLMKRLSVAKVGATKATTGRSVSSKVEISVPTEKPLSR